MTVIFLSLGSVVLGNAGLILWERSQAIEKLDRVMHRHEVIHGAERFLSRLKDAETGQRGYLLTERDDYLVPYNEGSVEALVELGALRALAAPSASQQALLEEIDELTRMKLAELEETVQLVVTDREGALQIVKTDFGQETMADIRALVDRFTLEEERVLDVFEQEYEARRAVVTYSVLGATAVLLLALGFFARVMSTRVAAPINILAGFANDIRDSVEREPSIRDAIDVQTLATREEGEVSTLAEALLEMREAIAQREQKLIERAQELEAEVHAREEAENALAHSQKLEAIGQLAGGIAHDFNNLLNVVMGYSEMLKLDLGDADPEIIGFIDGAIAAVLRGAELTQRLLAFSRKQMLSPERVASNDTVEELRRLLARTFPASVEVKHVLEDSLWPVYADRSQLENVLLNLSINARDAMPEGGHLTLSSRNVTLSAEDAAAKGRTPGDYVELAVLDDGEGISPENLQRVIEPYFTTKGPGRGSGLGLSMAFGFADQSGGFLEIESALGVGTRMALHLPRMDEADAIDRGDARAPALSKSAHGETILLVEDGAELLALYERQLRFLGYRVLSAENAQDAMARVDEADHIDVLLTDAILSGGTNGYELAQMVSARCPNVRVRFLTGYADTVFAEASESDASVEVLRKPFSLAQLSAHVAATSDSDVPA